MPSHDLWWGVTSHPCLVTNDWESLQEWLESHYCGESYVTITNTCQLMVNDNFAAVLTIAIMNWVTETRNSSHKRSAILSIIIIFIIKVASRNRSSGKATISEILVSGHPPACVLQFCVKCSLCIATIYKAPRLLIEHNNKPCNVLVAMCNEFFFDCL